MSAQADNFTQKYLGLPQMPLLIVASLFVMLALVFAGVIAVNNGGNLIFVLDDPLIHLRMAQNILGGHYGINVAEPSSPSSSILWPLLIAPIAYFSTYSLWLILLLNIIFSLLTIKILSDFISHSFPVASSRLKTYGLVFLLLASNSFALLFVGMEHNLQILLSVYAVFMVLKRAQFACELPVSYWVYAVLVIAPLIRYENILLSSILLFWLLIFDNWKRAIFGAALLLLSLVGFSLYLEAQGLSYLPASIQLKSAVQLPFDEQLQRKVQVLMATPKVWLFFAVAGLLFRGVLNAKHKPQSVLLLLFSLGTIAYALVGSFGWYYRYEAFFWACLLLILFSLYAQPVFEYLHQLTSYSRKLLLALLLLLLTAEHLYVSAIVPIAANNIYLQQFQMARFAKEYLNEPVAVNDIGWVSFNNAHYVLDLWGLASLDALKLRAENGHQQGEWMQPLVENHNVNVAMIYFDDAGKANGWFEAVPQSWVKLGVLNMKAMGISVSKRDVVFFATNEAAVAPVKAKLRAFKASLPGLANFTFL